MAPKGKKRGRPQKVDPDTEKMVKSNVEEILAKIKVSQRKKKDYVPKNRYECEKTPGGRFLCPICKKEFTRRNTVMLHVREMHEKIYRFLCPECGKGFNYSSAFTEHVKRHKDSHPYKCTKCKKGFTSDPKRQRHEKICGFTGAPQYMCEYGCTKMFVTEEYLKEHVFNKHTSGGFKCTHCKRVFAHRSTLYKHKKKGCKEEAAFTMPEKEAAASRSSVNVHQGNMIITPNDYHREEMFPIKQKMYKHQKKGCKEKAAFTVLEKEAAAGSVNVSQGNMVITQNDYHREEMFPIKQEMTDEMETVETVFVPEYETFEDDKSNIEIEQVGLTLQL